MSAHANWMSLVAAVVIGARAASGAAAERDLVAAVKSGEVEVDGTTALMRAVRNGDRQSEAVLLNAGANVNAVNRYGVTALSLAASTGDVAVLDLLLKAGADPRGAEANLPDGQTLLMLAARTGGVEILKRLIERGGNVNAVERRDGTSAGMWAVLGDHAAAVQTLAAAGADLDIRSLVTQYPHTPPAVIGDRVEEGVSYVGQTVLPKGGWTALMYAARDGAVNFPAGPVAMKQTGERTHGAVHAAGVVHVGPAPAGGRLPRQTGLVSQSRGSLSNRSKRGVMMIAASMAVARHRNIDNVGFYFA